MLQTPAESADGLAHEGVDRTEFTSCVLGGSTPTAIPQAPMRRLSMRYAQITDGRGNRSVCGQVETGSSNVAPSASPGCCTAANTLSPSAEISGPHVSAAVGTVRNWRTFPRSGPRVGTAKSPSLDPSTLPSDEIHRLPAPSNATLSGQEIGLT